MRSLVTRIPCRLIIYKHVNPAAAGCIGHRQCVAIADGERLFHHHVNAVAGALFHYSAVIEGIRVNYHSRRMSASDHLAQRRKVESWVELMLLSIEDEKRAFRFSDTHNLNVRAFQVVVKEPCDMAMRQTHDPDAKSCIGRLRNHLKCRCGKDKEVYEQPDSKHVLPIMRLRISGGYAGLRRINEHSRGAARAKVAQLSTLFLRPKHFADWYVDDASCHQLAGISPDALRTPPRCVKLCRTSAVVLSRTARGRLGRSLEPPSNAGRNASPFHAAVVFISGARLDRRNHGMAHRRAHAASRPDQRLRHAGAASVCRANGR